MMQRVSAGTGMTVSNTHNRLGDLTAAARSREL